MLCIYKFQIIGVFQGPGPLAGICALCFLIGGIPFGYFAGRLNGVDIRTQGSGNIGATNVFRVLGKKWGSVVFLLDFLKAFVPILLLKQFFMHNQLDSNPLPQDAFLIVCGILTVLGHNYSPYLGFKGGKGMASSAGFLMALMPGVCLIGIAVWLLLFGLFRYVSVASLVASVAVPALAFFLYKGQFWYIGLCVLLGTMSIWRHRSNISRLMQGKEHRFGTAKT